MQHTATHCNTLQRTATHCNALQCIAMHCTARYRTVAHCNTLQQPIWLSLQHTATHCNTLQHLIDATDWQHTAREADTVLCRVLQHIATHCNTLQRTATHCNVLQYTSTHCNTHARDPHVTCSHDAACVTCCSVLYSVLQWVVGAKTRLATQVAVPPFLYSSLPWHTHYSHLFHSCSRRYIVHSPMFLSLVHSCKVKLRMWLSLSTHGALDSTIRILTL